MPDIIKSCENIVSGYRKPNKHEDQFGLWGLFGDPRERDPRMTHKYGWTYNTLRPLVRAAGFIEIGERDTQFHGSGKFIRDFRLEARKP